MLHICRTCLIVIKDSLYFALDAIDSCNDLKTRRDKVMFCVPNMIVDVVENPVICQSCYFALQKAYDFKTKCLETEKRLQNFLDNNAVDNKRINLNDVLKGSNANYFLDEYTAINCAFANARACLLDEIDVITVRKSIEMELDGEENGRSDANDGRTNREANDAIKTEDTGHSFQMVEPIIEIKCDYDATYDVNMFDKKLFSCDICNKEFIAKYKLLRHRRMHTGEKPFSCMYCGKCFSRSDKLHLHLRIHTGEKPFRCEVCHKEFTRADKLKTHLRTHGDKVNESSHDVQL